MTRAGDPSIIRGVIGQIGTNVTCTGTVCAIRRWAQLRQAANIRFAESTQQNTALRLWLGGARRTEA